MDQLSEYLDRRELLRQRLKESFSASCADPEQRRQVQRKRAMYMELLTELNEQIRALDPSAAPERKEKAGVLSLDAVSAAGNAFSTLLPGKTPEREEHPERWAALAVAARHLTPRQAQALELRYNRGYSILKTAAEMGVTRTTAQRTLRRANERLSDWAVITQAAERCAFSPAVFAFDEFLDAAPHALPAGLKALLLALYDAPPSRYPSAAALARGLGRNYRWTCRSLGWLKTLLPLYGVPLTACHPLIAKSAFAAGNPDAAFESFNAFHRSNYHRGHRMTPEEHYAMRSPLIRHGTLEEAVLALLREAYGVEHAPEEVLGEALGLFDGETRLALARKRIDEGRINRDCGDNTAHKVRAVVEIAALYVAFRLDLRRIAAGAELWEPLLGRWHCFPGELETVLRLLLGGEIATVKQLARRLSVSDTCALKRLRRLAFYCLWWKLPEEQLPALLRRYLTKPAENRRTAALFRRAVRRREEHTC